jgi:serine/threonine protein kinase
LAQSLSDAGAVAKALDSSKVISRLADVEKKLNALANIRNVDVSALRADLVLATQQLQRNGNLVDSMNLNAEFERKAHNFEVAVKQVKDVQKRENRDKVGDVLAVLPSRPARFVKGQKMAPVAQVEANFGKLLAEVKALGKQATEVDKLVLLLDLDHVQQERDRRFKSAKLKMNSELRRDQLLLDNPQEDTLGPGATPEKFDVALVLDHLNVPAKLDKVNEQQAQGFATEAAKSLTQLMKTLKPGSDLLVDLGLKGAGDLKKELAHYLGIDVSKAKQNELTVLDTMAKTLEDAITKAYPDKADLSTFQFKTKEGDKGAAPPNFTIGGKQYVNPKYLASGSFGDVLKYEEKENPGKFVVLKTLNQTPPSKDPEKDAKIAEQKRGVMTEEVQMHRLAGGPKGHPNLIGMKGLVRDPEGKIHLAIEYAEGGTMADIGANIAGATTAGVLPDEARKVLALHMFKQAVEGMAHLKEQRLLHRDVKNENFLIDGDGTVKLADFGSTRGLDDSGTTPQDAKGVSRQFAGPEYATSSTVDTVTTKSDTYSLGVLLTRLTSPVQGEDAMASSFQSDWDFNPTQKPATALDRLRAAMLDDDPTKRPDLSAVQFSTYLDDDANDSQDPEKVKELVAATMAYAKNVGSRVKDEQTELLKLEGKILALERSKKDMRSADIANIDKEIKGLQAKMAPLRQAIDKVLNAPESKPFVEALKKAGNAIADKQEATPIHPKSKIVEGGKGLKERLERDSEVLKSLDPEFEKDCRLVLIHTLRAGQPNLDPAQRAVALALAKEKIKTLENVAATKMREGGQGKEGDGGAAQPRVMAAASEMAADLRKMKEGIETAQLEGIQNVLANARQLYSDLPSKAAKAFEDRSALIPLEPDPTQSSQALRDAIALRKDAVVAKQCVIRLRATRPSLNRLGRAPTYRQMLDAIQTVNNALSLGDATNAKVGVDTLERLIREAPGQN